MRYASIYPGVNLVLTDLFDLVGPGNYSYNRNTGQLKLYGTEWLVIGAKDEGSERYVRGLTVGIAICDELSLMPQSFFQMLLTRMSPEGARLYGTTNPESPYHWLKADYLDNAALRAKNLLWSDHYTMADNPNLTQEFGKRRSGCTGDSFTNGLSKAFGSLRKARSTKTPGPTTCSTIYKTSRSGYGTGAAISSELSP